jgi:DNA-binding beta-propeller fold protein YncE
VNRAWKARSRTLVGLMALVACTAVPGGVSAPATETAQARGYEVWVLDQSDSTADGGGTLYIYPRSALRSRAQARPQVIDLGGDSRALCLTRTGSAPRRPHMLMFNHAQTHAIVAFVATGHVLFLHARTRQPVGCIDVGAQAHDASPSPDGRYVLVANQNGKLLQRILTNYALNQFALDGTATIDLARCRTPSGALCEDPALRPDNAPIFARTDHRGRLGFVPLRGGGMLVVNPKTTPMAIVAEYDKTAIHPNGFGAVQAQGKMYVTSGGGTAANPLEHDVYAVSLKRFGTGPAAPNTPALRLVYSHDAREFVDAHGVVATRPMMMVERVKPRGRKMKPRVRRVQKGPYLWVADRAANRIVVVNTQRDRVVNEINLTGRFTADPAPDLMDVSPSGDRVFVTLRGPNPLTGNIAGINNAIGSAPGLGVLRVTGHGRGGAPETFLPITHLVGGVERADPHAIAVRRT